MIEVSVITGDDPLYHALCERRGPLYEGWLGAYEQLGPSERDIYSHPAYVMSWIDAHLRTDGSRFYLLHLTDDGDTIAVIPLKHRHRLPGLGAVLSSPMIEVSASTAIAGHHREEAIRALFRTRIDGQLPVVIGFPRIDQTNRLGDVDAPRLVTMTPYTRNYIRLPGQYAELIASKAKLRRNLGVSQRKAEKLGLSMEVTDLPGDMPSAFEQFAEYEYGGWKQDERRAMKNNPFVHELYRNITLSFGSRGLAVMFTLRIGGDFASSYLCIVHDRVLYGLKTAFNESYRHLSPGNLLFNQILTEYCPAHGITEYNTMSNSPWFRNQFEPSLLPTYSLHLFPPGIRGALAKTGYRLLTRMRKGG